MSEQLTLPDMDLKTNTGEIHPEDPNDPEVSRQKLLDKANSILVDVTDPLNTAYNEKVSHELQAGDAAALVAPLERASDLARLASELLTAQESAKELSPEAQAAIEKGETPESILALAEGLRKQAQDIQTEQETQFTFEEDLADARTDYIKALRASSGVRGLYKHGQKKQKLAEAEEAYNQAFVVKIQELIKIDPTHRKATYVPATMRHLQENKPSLETLSENHLHVLVDQLSREQILKTKEIKENSSSKTQRFLRALSNSRTLRVAIGGAVFAGGIVALHEGLSEHVGEASKLFEQIMPLIAGYAVVGETTNGLSEAFYKFESRRKLKKDISDIAESTFLTEKALQTIYSGIEYQQGNIKDRQTGQTEAENREVLGKVDQEFMQLEKEGARGGKPYKAEIILPYVADLYLRNPDKVNEIVDSDDPQAAFLLLCTEIITKDTYEFSKQTKANKAKRVAFQALAIGSTLIANRWLAQIHNVQLEAQATAGSFTTAHSV
jgi:hypothetical protein